MIDIVSELNFYQKELTYNILPFWSERCIDSNNGGFFNCFDNTGQTLISHDKYTWSQGRFVWIWSKLASLQGNTFNTTQKLRFLKYAQMGRNFLLKYSLIDKNDYRCVYLMDQFGTPKKVSGYDNYDLSISSDCFVIMALAKYTQITGDATTWDFCKKLYTSVKQRLSSGIYNTLPYPVSSGYYMHGTPMIMTNVTIELYYTAKVVEPSFCNLVIIDMEYYSNEIFKKFIDKNYILHEIITSEGNSVNNLFGQHINPGHTFEDMWFQIKVMDLLEKTNRLKTIAFVTKKTFELGWDKDMGGIFHFADITGGCPHGDTGNASEEPLMKLVLDDWGSKLWWVHSEALYTSLLLYMKTEDIEFLNMYKKIRDYTFEIFPNPNRDIREWCQIRSRDGQPQNKVVALPVKDPYHIIRDIVLIIELLESMIGRKGK